MTGEPLSCILTQANSKDVISAAILTKEIFMENLWSTASPPPLFFPVDDNERETSMHEKPGGAVQPRDTSSGACQVSTARNKSIDWETMHSTNGADLFPIDLQLSNPILVLPYAVCMANK